MAKKFSDVFSSIKYAQMQAKHDKGHVGGSTDDEEHGAVSGLEFDQQVKHAKKRSMTESESVKRTQTNLKNIEAAKTGFAVDKDEEFHRKRAERLKKAHNEYVKNNPNSIFKRMEEVEHLDEVSLDTARNVHRARRDNWETAKKTGDKDNIQKTYGKMSKAFKHVVSKDKKYIEKLHADMPKTPEARNKMYNDKYEYDRKMGYSTESVNEAIGATASRETHEGQFQEKDYGKHFTYKKTKDAWAKKHNLPHEIDVHDGVRYGHVKGTVAHVATNENRDGTPKIEKWKLKNHKKWMKESRMSDIVREAYAKGKKNKKNEMSDKDISGKVEKFEADPQLTDTLQK